VGDERIRKKGIIVDERQYTDGKKEGQDRFPNGLPILEYSDSVAV
jgi:hypothetical protein